MKTSKVVEQGWLGAPIPDMGEVKKIYYTCRVDIPLHSAQEYIELIKIAAVQVIYALRGPTVRWDKYGPLEGGRFSFTLGKAGIPRKSFTPATLADEYIKKAIKMRDSPVPPDWPYTHWTKDTMWLLVKVYPKPSLVDQYTSGF